MIYGTLITTVPVDIEDHPDCDQLIAAQIRAIFAGDELLPGPPHRIEHMSKSGRLVAHYRWPVVVKTVTPKLVAGYVPLARRTCGHGKLTRYNMSAPGGAYIRHDDGTDCDVITLMEDPS